MAIAAVLRAAQGASRLVSTSGRACVAFRSVWNSHGPKDPVGEEFHSNDHDIQKLGISTVSWHAGPLHKLQGQIEDGEFKNKGTDIYFGSRVQAGHFGGHDHDSVMCLIGAPPTTPVDVNEEFGTSYFPAGRKQRVYILSAHKMSAAIKEREISLVERARLSAQAAIQTVVQTQQRA